MQSFVKNMQSFVQTMLSFTQTHRLCNHCADFAFNCTNVRFAVDKMICSGWITQQAIGKYWMTRSQADRYMYYVFNIYSILWQQRFKKKPVILMLHAKLFLDFIFKDCALYCLSRKL